MGTYTLSRKISIRSFLREKKKKTHPSILVILKCRLKKWDSIICLPDYKGKYKWYIWSEIYRQEYLPIYHLQQECKLDDYIKGHFDNMIFKTL